MRRMKCLTRAHGIFQSIIGVLSLIVFVNSAVADGTTFAIDPQDLASALKAFAVQSHREIFFSPELARGRRSNGVKGKYNDLKALNIILEGTGLDFSITPSDAILIRVPAGKNESSPPTTTTSANTESPIHRSWLARLHLYGLRSPTIRVLRALRLLARPRNRPA